MILLIFRIVKRDHFKVKFKTVKIITTQYLSKKAVNKFLITLIIILLFINHNLH